MTVTNANKPVDKKLNRQVHQKIVLLFSPKLKIIKLYLLQNWFIFIMYWLPMARHAKSFTVVLLVEAFYRWRNVKFSNLFSNFTRAVVMAHACSPNT